MVKTAHSAIPVMLVDDRPENLTALRALLSAMPLELRLYEAGSGNEALRLSLKSDFALILLDVQMPGMDGMETATLLRANPKTRQLPIIFVTAGLNEQMQLFKGYESGAVDYLIKPIEPFILQSKVKVFCELYAQRRALESRESNLESMVAKRTAELQALALHLGEEVAARHASDEALRESELRLRRVIDSAYEAFISMNDVGAIIDWNCEAENMFGWSRELAIGCSVAELIVPERYRSAHREGLHRMAGNGAAISINRRIEISALHRDGREFPVELSIWKIPSAKAPLFGAFVRDITDRKRAEEELRRLNEGLELRVGERTQELRQAMDRIIESEKLASLGSIVAGVAHELNTPIGNMLVMASTLGERIAEVAGSADEGKLTRTAFRHFAEECVSASAILVRSAQRASVLVESFKNISVDQTSRRRRKFDLHDMLADILITLGTLMRHAGLTHELRVARGIAMDSFPGDLEQVISNLIINTIRHGIGQRKCGHIIIDASVHEGLVEIVYQDDGVGIAPALHRKIFEPFYTTTLGQGGSGLGMFIVHNLIHGVFKGEIHLDSEIGHGVVFTLRLPAQAE
ncbi:MAG: PAS domain S-box protein [Pseudomonadota bacterium]